MEGVTTQMIQLDMTKEEDFRTRMKDINYATKLQLKDMEVLIEVERISDHFMMCPSHEYTITKSECENYGAIAEFFKGQSIHVQHIDDSMILSRK